ncbi:nickel ABC transporter substrate-binding protein [Paenibacillus sp. NPDC056933]|uniref:nickel ABC transporter substrate-binding protein n=1 Tax=Paenibacillus sp. NPDC056933 TaxID=3345968 RepID=UPI00363B803A
MQKNKVFRAMLGLLFVFMLVTVAACSGKEQTAPSVTANQGEEKTKEITVSWMRDLGPSNPHAYYPSQLFSQSMIYEPLVKYGEGGEIKPHLATRWEISSDGKEYIFYLRDDVKYSDGTSFNAASVKRNMDAILQNQTTHSWLGTAKLLDHVEAVDEYVVKLVMKESYYPVLQDLTTVRPFRFLADAGFPEGDNTLESIQAPIGTGPWILDEYKQDEYSVFVRNPDYWGEQPELEKVTVRIIPDAETRVLAFEKGDLDLIFGEGSISLDEFTRLQKNENYESDLSGPLGTRSLILNTQNEKLADRRVRLALHHGFDKASLIKGITSDVEQPAAQVLSTDYPYVSKTFTAYDYDVNKAIAYLDEAGWTVPSTGGIREKNGEKLSFELMFDTTDRIQKAMGEAIQAEWAALGVELRLTGLELTEQTKRFREGDYDLNFWFNSGVPYDPHTLINAVAEKSFGVAEAHTNIAGKEQLDQQIKQVLASVNVEERQQLYDQILQKIQDESVIIPLSYIRQYNVYQKNLSNVSFPESRWDHPFNTIKVK